MKRDEMEKALATGFNKQGRTVSDSMRAKYLAALAEVPAGRVRMEYGGFVIDGQPNRTYFVDGLPHMMFTSAQGAKDAVDRCLAIRAEVAGEA